MISITTSQPLFNTDNVVRHHHHQLKMQVYSKPNFQGEVQTIRTYQDHGPSLCYNLASKRIGSYDINDPNTKIIFYRSMDCRGAPFIKGDKIEQNHVMKKVKSVSIIRLTPILVK